MAYRLSFEGIRNIGDELHRLEKETPLIVMDAGEEVASQLINYMEEGVNVWKGDLKNSLSFMKNNDEIDIYGLYYWRYLENGVIIRIPTPKLIEWAVSKWGPRAMKGLAGLIIKGYTEPHPFVEPAIRMIQSNIDDILNMELNR